MTTYKGINGFAVQSVASDPSPLDEGQVWYNNATYAFKLASVTTVGTFASGGNMNTARRLLSGAGTQTAALAAAGLTGGPVATVTNISEEYDGSAWTSGGTMNTSRYFSGGAGTQTAALMSGGANSSGVEISNVESYNGTSWTSVTGLPTATQGPLSYCGTQTSALVAGGFAPGLTTATFEYDGSIWTTGGNLGTAVGNQGGAGTQTAALSIGGERSTANTAATEEYDGTSWTVGGNLNTVRAILAGSGTQTAALAFGGTLAPGVSSATELYNGTSWTSNPTGLSTARSGIAGAGAGTQTISLAFGGGTPTVSTSTEEWTGPGVATTKTITTS